MTEMLCAHWTYLGMWLILPVIVPYLANLRPVSQEKITRETVSLKALTLHLSHVCPVLVDALVLGPGRVALGGPFW